MNKIVVCSKQQQQLQAAPHHPCKRKRKHAKHPIFQIPSFYWVSHPPDSDRQLWGSEKMVKLWTVLKRGPPLITIMVSVNLSNCLAHSVHTHSRYSIIYTHTHLHIHTHTYTYTDNYIDSCKYASIDKYHTHTHTHTHMYKTMNKCYKTNRNISLILFFI